MSEATQTDVHNSLSKLASVWEISVEYFFPTSHRKLIRALMVIYETVHCLNISRHHRRRSEERRRSRMTKSYVNFSVIPFT